MGEPLKRKDYELGYRVEVDAESALFEFLYPMCEGHPKHIFINQESVRASDGIRVSYDYDRDGWKIEQPVWTDEDRMGETYVEVAFVQSWGNDTGTGHD